jgi:superfamily II DNA or RNA helicase
MAENIINVEYKQTGTSKKNNELGMREMQAKAYKTRNAQYILLKAPPASGKSRALMFLALDKLHNQNIKKVIVAVPEKSIGGSFTSTDLKTYGFFADWEFDDKYNLCTPGEESSKVGAFKDFMDSDEKILVCTHATLRFAFDQLDEEKFNDTLVAIDEFHHVSQSGENKLGRVIDSLIEKTSAHIIAMTGSYFRGDAVAVMSAQDEEKFEKVSYNYYEQLNGYEFLKTLGIGYHFYQGKYTAKDAIGAVLDTDKKTILHIPNVNSAESTRDKYKEVDTIIDIVGVLEHTDENGIMHVKRHADGKIIKVADLVNDDEKEREKIANYLRNIKSVDDLDLIIALGMAKEGFDWPYCEHVLTVGYRSSLTEIIQIIGRATRDSDNKNHAQFTNLIAQPNAHNDEVKVSVNNMLKAITASLLMEQVLAPNFKFKPRFSDDHEDNKPGEMKIKGFKLPSTKKVEDIVESDLNDLKAKILQDKDIIKTIDGGVDAEYVNTHLIPKIIREKYSDLSEEEVEELRQHVVVDSVVTNAEFKEEGGKQFIKMANKFINLDELSIDLIDTINPFQKAYEILSKSVDTPTLKLIQDAIESTRIKMTESEAVILYNNVIEFKKEKNRMPDLNSENAEERRMAQAIIYLKNLKRKRENESE